MSEEVFEIRGADGLARRGILTRPESGDGATAVLLLPAGLKYRIGPHRLNVKLARRVAARGYTVLRLDPAGLGESDGALAAGPMADRWNQFEAGDFADDVLLAVRALRERGASRVIAGGLCGGAIIAQHAAAREPGAIDGVISIGTPVTLAARGASLARPASAGIARHHFRGYLRKLGSRDAWARLLRGESDFGAIRSTLARLLPGEDAPAYPNDNPAFIASFRTLEARATPHLLLFGGSDNRWLEFEEMILRRYLRGAPSGKGYETALIPQANHELHLAEWQQGAAERILAWLEARFPAATAP